MQRAISMHQKAPENTQRATSRSPLALLLGRCFSAGLSHSPYYEHPLVLPQFKHL